MLATVKNAQIIELDRGAAAHGVFRIWQQLSVQRNSEGISFFTSRPWLLPDREYDQVPSSEKAAGKLPTHLLYRSIAYPITENPLTIGRETDAGKTGTRVYSGIAGVAPGYCTIELRGREVVLDDYSSDGIFVDETRVNGSKALKLGQTIRLGKNGEQLQLIACLEYDET